MRLLCLLVLLTSVSAPALSQVVVIALDPKPELVDGELKIVQKRAEDSVVVYNFTGSAPALLGRVRLPTSFQGPPGGIAVNTDASMALVGAATKIDPADPLQLIPDNRLSVVDLKSTPIRVIQTLELPAPPAAVAINPAGTFALVTHPDGDKISLLTITGKRVAIAGMIPFEKGARPLAVAFAQHGARETVLRLPTEYRGVDLDLPRFSVHSS
jgi:DNA-binding beta-propeller fold protein YncE